MGNKAKVHKALAEELVRKLSPLPPAAHRCVLFDQVISESTRYHLAKQRVLRRRHLARTTTTILFNFGRARPAHMPYAISMLHSVRQELQPLRPKVVLSRQVLNSNSLEIFCELEKLTGEDVVRPPRYLPTHRLVQLVE